MASNQLSFTVWLNDRTQKGFKGVQKSFAGLQSMADRSSKAWQTAGTGAAGLWASGAMFDGLTGPAREMNAARGELMSLFNDSALGADAANTVQNQAIVFSETYGKSASDFVRASYDIQSAIDGLSANNLATFTNASAVLATATKADTATITNYMGTMYGIFKKNANAIGKDKWVEQIAGQTATAVQLFKTTGSAMNEAFAGVGARATNQGISSAEQFAILGSLQSTMQGSVAGTAYAGFLDALPNAQKVLGISLSDANGKALGMVQIIDKLKAKLGDDLGLKEMGILNTAFGTNAAGMLGNLWHDTDALKANIESLNHVSGMERAVTMAKNIADPYAQLGQAVNNVKIVFGQALSGSLQPFINYMIAGGQTLRRWMNLFPNLTKMVGYLVIGIGILSASMALLSLVTGVTQLAWVGLTAIWAVSKFFMGGMWAGIAGLTKLLITMIPAVWGVGAAFIATIGWIPVAIVGVITAVAALWAYWDDFIGWLSDAWAKVKGWFADGDEATIDIDARREALNKRLPDVNQTANLASVQPIPSSYINNNNSNKTNSNTIGTMNIYPQQLTDPNAINNALARWSS
ncbi:phage tail tape measure protein [Vibrio sp. V39_P1S14PM300]|uniref:phage tail tape measure protein n=1 Tax=Vibrio sp. V39_P1S14PM300 TaxID=1938690 RepID=UPI0013732001|nr:phage tail tape measure protein [Vibrio sp. V39_P1S14PM300]NAX21282.1 phage tail tape measure protein [Vibrio sp. V39_P1S14PM300]